MIEIKSRLIGEYAAGLARRLWPERAVPMNRTGVAESLGRLDQAGQKAGHLKMDREELALLLSGLVEAALSITGGSSLQSEGLGPDLARRAGSAGLAARLGLAQSELAELLAAEGNRLASLSRLAALAKDKNKLAAPPLLLAARSPEIERPILASDQGVFRELLNSLPDVAANPYTVLISGPTGTGKELIARRLHALSPFATGPFVPVDCAALPAGLMESELFGHVKGAFTGAIRSQPGRIELAVGGSLFLDEVAELEPGLQVKLLRFLQERVVQRLGGGEPRAVNLRVVAATSRNLEEMMARGDFRPDLYYRLATLPLEVPRLSDRPQDLPVLIDHFLNQAAQETRKVRKFSARVLGLMSGYEFPGNVRELVNFINHAVALSTKRVIDLEDLPPAVLNKLTGGRGSMTHWLNRVDNLGLPPGSEAQVARLLAINDGGKLTNAQLRRALDCSDTTARSALTKLVEAGLLRAEGSRGGRRYQVISEGDNQ